LKPTPTWPVDPADISVLRGLLRRKRELAQDPSMADRSALWTEHAALRSRRPMVLAETGGVLDELIPLSSLRCREEWARAMERSLHEQIFRAENVQDDWVLTPFIDYQWFVDLGDYGVETELVRGNNEGKLGSYHWEPPLRDLERDFDRLRPRIFSVDRPRTMAWKAHLEEHFGDILPVRRRGGYWWTSGLTWAAINLVGLEPFMLAMHDNPPGLHRLMAFLRDDFLQLMDWVEREGLLSANNEDDYIGSGSIGYTSELPGGNAPARIADLWGLSESQETVGVSPRMFEEFVFPYQEPVARRFGLLYYGCCEPIHKRIKIIRRLPNLRRVSVSPWCDQEAMVNELGANYIHCRKPNPTLISTETFDEDAIRADLHRTLEICRGVPLELVMKDVHTLNDQPERLSRWVQLARQEINKMGLY
jgi:hypothetical protein